MARGQQHIIKIRDCLQTESAIPTSILHRDYMPSSYGTCALIIHSDSIDPLPAPILGPHPLQPSQPHGPHLESFVAWLPDSLVITCRSLARSA